VSGEPVALIPQCEERKRIWIHNDGDRWKAYLSSDDEIVVYRPECAEREFDD
jgi:hypothetical protein